MYKKQHVQDVYCCIAITRKINTKLNVHQQRDVKLTHSRCKTLHSTLGLFFFKEIDLCKKKSEGICKNILLRKKKQVVEEYIYYFVNKTNHVFLY